MTTKARDRTGSTPAGSDVGPAGPTFLVVDDDAMVRKIVARGLATLDPAEILEVEDGVAAQAVLREKAVDVVVTDVLMPRMTGLELMEWAQESCPEPLWIVLSGLETFDAAVDALQLGAFDYLGKPPEVQRVRVAVRNALDQIELRRERARLYNQLEHSNAQLAEKVVQLEQLCRLLEEQAAIIQSDLHRAEVIQRALLPREPPDIDGWCLQSLYRPGSSMGGDLYDVKLLDQQHLGLMIADAAGHGVAAAMLSVMFKLRLLLTDEEGGLFAPAQVLGNLNSSLYATLSAPGAFITAAYVLLDRRTGRARIASAGHPPCILATPDGEYRLLARTGPALGIDATACYRELEVELHPGDRLFLYTDGVLGSGAASSTSEDIARRLCSGIDSSDLPDALYRAATQDAEEDRDDITVLLLERGQGVSRFDHSPGPEQARARPPSPAPQPQLLQGVRDDRAYISVAGTLGWTMCQALLDAARAQLDRHHALTLDLGACDYMDSTSLGTLHEIVASQPDEVCVQRLPDSLRLLLEELSMDAVLSRVSPSSEPLPEVMEAVPAAEADAARQGARMLSAHEALASLSPENLEKFRDVVDSLRADLDRKD